MTLPNFLIIGANKAGTTSLFHYLRQHPRVFLPATNKEPMFFLYGWQELPTVAAEVTHHFVGVTQSLVEYERLFADAGAALALGEASTAYLAVPECADHIRAVVPSVKLAAVLRDPIGRAYSAYRHYQRLGAERRSFTEAVDDELSGRTRHLPSGQEYLAVGRYGAQLERYFSLFPRQQVWIRLHEELERDSESVVRDLLRFLGVDADVLLDLEVRHNTAANEGRLVRLRRRLRRKLGRDLEVDSVARGRVGLERNLVERMLLHFRDDVRLLERQLGRDLSRWLAHP